MSSFKLLGLIAALMLSAALACSAAMLASSVVTGAMPPTPADIFTVTAEAGVLLGLLVWLGSTLRGVHARGR